MSLGRGLCWGIPLLVGSVLAAAWVFSGGFFAPGHDAFGRVPIPGDVTVTLPAGPARLYVQEHGTFGKNESATIPVGIQVSVQPVAGGAALPLTPNTHAAATTVGQESWNTYATFDVPAAGAYRVSVLDPGDNGDARHSVTIGKGPWAPLPPWMFGLGILAVAAAIGLIADRIRLSGNARREKGGSPYEL
ncbi:hypothetical protein PT015_24325 [Candidatus Mycobacterium wuenschmannii]|uniref:Secreted protein n=1 Tax=Candidatus Mycobacterium wuenschmannii TaxID=3027808 RepID=A0ABY8VYA7_9MYCO|nr:hypothetical protein [Candidatus Mycobacterium wuenschmannii]WIM87906.1 hypothetical protein PT015_24325 [Candidatus Mycobacterium wuenschmannii]